MFGFWVTLIIIIICASILFGYYMKYCSKNGVGMFDKSHIKGNVIKRIEKLENRLDEMENK